MSNPVSTSTPAPSRGAGRSADRRTVSPPTRLTVSSPGRGLLACLFAAAVQAADPATAAPPAPAATASLSVEEGNVLAGQQLFHQARELTRKRDYVRAADALHRLIAMPFPPDPAARELMAGAHASLAELLLLQRRFSEAEQVAARGLGMTGTDQQPGYLRADLYELLGQIAFAEGRKDQAQSLRQRALQCRGAQPGGR